MIENCVVSYTPLSKSMLLAVLNRFQVILRGGLRFLGLRFLDLENEDPGQTFG